MSHLRIWVPPDEVDEFPKVQPEPRTVLRIHKVAVEEDLERTSKPPQLSRPRRIFQMGAFSIWMGSPTAFGELRTIEANGKKSVFFLLGPLRFVWGV